MNINYTNLNIGSAISLEGRSLQPESSRESYIAKGRNKDIEQPKSEK